MSKERYIVYVDTGGTFSDATVVRSNGEIITGKSPTTYNDLSECFFKCIEVAAKKVGKTLQELLASADVVGYGTTIGTNIMVTGSGAPKLGFITTRGAEDRTIITRLRVAGLSRKAMFHEATADKPAPLISSTRIRGVVERIDSKGEVVIPLREYTVRKAIQELLDKGIEGIVVGLLWSVLNPKHEVKIREIIQEMAPDLPVAISSEVAPTIREYPRFMSTIIDLYIGRALRELLNNIKNGLKEHGYNSPLQVMQAAGGVSRSEIVKPATTLHSGPIGGLAGVEFFKNIYGFEDALGSDVGGTSFDITVSPKEMIDYVSVPVVGRYEIATPMREIVTLGAGGGTIAYFDTVTGNLCVGPESAGSTPGPIAYDLGGEQPTVTDADIIMNRIDPDYFLGGKFKLNRDKAFRVMKEKIADHLNIDVYEAAERISKIIDNKMAAALEAMLASKGLDQEKFAIFCFGGAGASHCAGYTEFLNFSRVIIPVASPTFCAFGAATADIEHRYEASPFIRISGLPLKTSALRFDIEKITSLNLIPAWVIERFNRMFADLENKADVDMKEEGFGQETIQKQYEVLGRYGGQLYELRCAIPVSSINSIEDFNTILRTFEDEYSRVYGEQSMMPRGGLEFVSIAVTAKASGIKPNLSETSMSASDTSVAQKSERQAYFNGRFVRTLVYELEAMKPGMLVEGPAILEGSETTVVVPENRVVFIDKFRNMVMERK